MKTFAIIRHTIILLCVVVQTFAQDTRTFNQNASRSNHYYGSVRTGFNFSFSPVFSTSLNAKTDSLLFRGSGGGIKFGGDYFFGKAGIGLSSGFGSSTPDNTSINHFLQRTNVPLDQLLITRSNQQNMYLLLGPSVRFGNMVEMTLHAKGGMFINNGGLTMIQQRGSTKMLYANQSTSKTFYPGFQTGMNIQYSTKSDAWSFGVGADYLGTKTEVNNFDARRGGGIEGLKLTRNISDLVAGITVRYNIRSARETSSGMATGRLLPTVNKREIVSQGDSRGASPTGRLLPTVNKKTIAIDEPGVQRIAIDESGVHRNSSQACGPVTVKSTDAQGNVTQTTFSCPDDALAYSEKINSGKQKQWVPANFRTAPNATDKKGIISGRLSWPSSNSFGIVTNENIGQNAKTTQNSSFGTMVRMSAREVGTGLATGKKASESATGMASGKLYESVFEEGNSGVCSSCVADVKSNPLYHGTGSEKNNPLYEGRIANPGAEDCDGIGGIDVSLVDFTTGKTMARTKTEPCGDFFFANVPEGSYLVKVSGEFASRKGYDVHTRSKTDLLGDIQQADAEIQLLINSEGSKNTTGINTPHSNIKNLDVIEADIDGNGEFESLRAQATFSDGTTSDITANAKRPAGAKSVIIDGQALRMRKRPELLRSNETASARHLASITVAAGDVNGDGIAGDLRATATFSDGKTEDVTAALTINSSHPNIKQYDIAVADLDGDGFADAVIKSKTKSNQSNDRLANSDLGNGQSEDGIIKTKTKSNQSNDRLAGDFSSSQLPGAIINTSRSNIKNRVAEGDVDDNVSGDLIWSPRSNVTLLRVGTGDLDGDGVSEILIGNSIPDFTTSRETLKSHFETGDKPTQSQRMPGDPIPGLDVKLGKNPGGQNIQATTTDAEGQFQFRNLEGGDYLITVKQRIIINNETIVNVTSARENIVSGESNLKDANVNAGNPATDNTSSLRKAQNNNTVRSNRTELKSVLIEADLDGDGEYETNVTNRLNDEITIDESGAIVASQTKAGISTSRSNIRSRSSLQAKDEDTYLSLGTAIIDNREVNVRSVLKTKHDTVKNSINNIR